MIDPERFNDLWEGWDESLERAKEALQRVKATPSSFWAEEQLQELEKRFSLEDRKIAGQMRLLSVRQKRGIEKLRSLGLSYKEVSRLYGCPWSWCRSQLKTLRSGRPWYVERQLRDDLIGMARAYPSVVIEIMRLLVKAAKNLIAKKGIDETATRELFQLCYSVCQALQ